MADDWKREDGDQDGDAEPAAPESDRRRYGETLDSEGDRAHEEARNRWRVWPRYEEEDCSRTQTGRTSREARQLRAQYGQDIAPSSSTTTSAPNRSQNNSAEDNQKEMTFESYIKSRLMDYVIEEAYTNGGVEPMLAVAQVIANRVKAGWQGGDWLRVISTAPEYRGTLPDKTIVRVDPRDGNFRELMRRIDEVYYGTADDTNVNTRDGKSLYYAEIHNINRDWFNEHILNDHTSHPRIAKVGQLTFFG